MVLALIALDVEDIRKKRKLAVLSAQAFKKSFLASQYHSWQIGALIQCNRSDDNAFCDFDEVLDLETR